MPRSPGKGVMAQAWMGKTPKSLRQEACVPKTSVPTAVWDPLQDGLQSPEDLAKSLRLQYYAGYRVRELKLPKSGDSGTRGGLKSGTSSNERRDRMIEARRHAMEAGKNRAALFRYTQSGLDFVPIDDDDGTDPTGVSTPRGQSPSARGAGYSPMSTPTATRRPPMRTPPSSGLSQRSQRSGVSAAATSPPRTLDVQPPWVVRNRERREAVRVSPHALPRGCANPNARTSMGGDATVTCVETRQLPQGPMPLSTPVCS